MTDRDCIAFLQWALPRMRMRWPGFRKVRRQVCKRISRRMATLDLPDSLSYREYLETAPEEWRALDSLCRITISRFYRDRAVFDRIAGSILPRLAAYSAGTVRSWSAGCASGEEAYTLKIIWELLVPPSTSGKTLHMLATDADSALLERARAALYPASAIRDLPGDCAKRAFDRDGDRFALRRRFQVQVEFRHEDIRESMPLGPFDLILCRNLVFTYFDVEMQHAIACGLAKRLAANGVLVTGIHESVPAAAEAGLAAGPPAFYVRAG